MNYNNSSQSIYKTFIFKPIESTGDTTTISACTSIHTNEVVSCSGDSKIQLGTGEIKINNDLLPSNNTTSIGLPNKRFRSLNAHNGSVTVWSAATIDLGLDSNNESRKITANNSIIQNDILTGGNY